MAYQFCSTDKSVQSGLRRIAVEQIEGALASLDDAAVPLPTRVHEARKAVKKVRALVRLVRPVFPKYDLENQALRDAGKRLAALREAHAARATLADLSQVAGIEPARSYPSGSGVPASASADIAAFQAALAEIRTRAPRWKTTANGFDALEGGLEDTLEKARRAMKRARHRGGDEAIHEWRKRAKDHWYHARLLEQVWPDLMIPHIAAANRLGEVLGDYNDLSDLMRDLARADGADATRARLVEQAADRREALLDEAQSLGRRLFAGPPEAISARWRGWWEVWRA